ncbi:MAG: hypothetical protein HUU32_04515 [Calditrichaceae bacterium]|nr:hypothetical protein [Calditrichia bacterium]NUQ40638.1 hypothetical protein [Calditrichaceae bacterium]
METLIEHIKHLRQIHFWLIFVSSVLLYIIVASCNKSPEQLKELSHFENYLIRAAVSERELEALYPSWIKEQRKNLSQKLFKGLLKEDDVFLNSLDIKWPESKIEIDMTKPIDNIYKQISSYPIEVRTIDEIIKEQKDSLNLLIRQLYAGRNLSEARVESLSPYWSKRTSDNQIEVEIILWGKDKMSPNAVDTYVRKKGIFQFSSRNYQLPTPINWSKDYPLLYNVYSQIKDKTIEEARKWIDDQKTSDIKDLTLPIAGIKIRSHDIGIILPLIQFSIILYFIAYISEFRRVVNNNKHQDTFVLFWIAIMPSRLSQLISIFTICLLPTGTIWLSLSRIVWPSSWLRPLILSLIFGIISFWAYHETSKIKTQLSSKNSG